MRIITKNILKNLLNSVSLVLVSPMFAVWRCFGKKDSAFWTFSQFLSLFPGVLGNYLRKNFYRISMTRCDKDCNILFGTIFSQADTEIGKGVYIGPCCNIGTCKIEDHCTLGSNVHIISGKHQHYFNDPDIPIQEQGGLFEKMTIGEDTWIGNGALVMANIGKKSIIGAGSVVTKDMENFSIAAGNPAKVIRKRK